VDNADDFIDFNLLQLAHLCVERQASIAGRATAVLAQRTARVLGVPMTIDVDPDEPKTRLVSVRISERLFSHIKSLADSERRSLANLATLLLEQGLENYRSPNTKRSRKR
jgi:hypothetical protein